jgi:iron(III) transport system substrate-binding protein
MPFRQKNSPAARRVSGLHNRSFALVFITAFFVCSLTSIGRAADETTVAEANKEGKLVFYSGIFDAEARALIAKFETKYPAIKTTLYRAGGVSLVSRIQNEQRAGAHLWDVFNSAGLEGFLLLEQGYFSRYDSTERNQFGEGFKDAEGYWTTMYATPYVLTYNTKLVSAKDLPKDYMQLLEPKWYDKLAIDPDDIEWYVNLRKIWGEDKTRKFFSGLAKQKVTIRRGRALQTDLVAAGEVAILVNNYHHIAVRTKQRGGPVEWLALDPVITAAGPITINKLAPHPNAAKVFVDFCLSKEGQDTLVQQGRTSGRLDLSRNPLAAFKPVKVVPSDLTLGKVYIEARQEYERYLGIKGQ